MKNKKLAIRGLKLLPSKTYSAKKNKRNVFVTKETRFESRDKLPNRT